MPIRRVPLSRPSIGPRELEAVREVLESGWLTHGEYNRKFEEAFAQRIGVPEAVSLNSCTSALEIALRILGISGEVILPSMTFVATANAVELNGGIPVFCEVDPATRNVTAEAIEKVITPRTEAVIVVHFAGQACNMEEIIALCQRRGLALIEDSAQALGATWTGRPVGSFAMGCFSFFPTKNITTGEGGMLTCQGESQARQARALAAHGIFSSTMARKSQARSWAREAQIPGHNYRLAHPLAAVGYHQLLRLDELNARRVALAQAYTRALQPLSPIVRTPTLISGATHVYQMYTIQVPVEWRDRLVHELRGQGVEASVHFDPPVHLHPYYRVRRSSSLPITEKLSKELITLPLYPDMTPEEQEWVIQSLQKLCEEIAHA